jgi:hypothetical protein
MRQTQALRPFFWALLGLGLSGEVAAQDAELAQEL